MTMAGGERGRGLLDLRAFLDVLRREGELVEVEAPVDPYLEAAEVHRRVIAAGGPALLFRRPTGDRVLRERVAGEGVTLTSGDEAVATPGAGPTASGASTMPLVTRGELEKPQPCGLMFSAVGWALASAVMSWDQISLPVEASRQLRIPLPPSE